MEVAVDESLFSIDDARRRKNRPPELSP